MGECFNVILTSRGEVYTHGENIEGQLGISNFATAEFPIKVQGLPLISSIKCGRNHVIALQADLKTLYGWGSNALG